MEIGVTIAGASQNEVDTALDAILAALPDMTAIRRVTLTGLDYRITATLVPVAHTYARARE